MLLLKKLERAAKWRLHHDIHDVFVQIASRRVYQRVDDENRTCHNIAVCRAGVDDVARPIAIVVCLHTTIYQEFDSHTTLTIAGSSCVLEREIAGVEPETVDSCLETILVADRLAVIAAGSRFLCYADGVGRSFWPDSVAHLARDGVLLSVVGSWWLAFSYASVCDVGVKVDDVSDPS
uniref:Protein phosphatase n=1 Tax=Caenorhabditis japonica TaxID=281687 RepID=A0A8R1ILN6_CAEJA